MKKLLAALLAVSALIGLTALPAFAADHTIKGTLTLTDSDIATTPAPKKTCHGQGGYDDITAGAQVRVRNGDGKTLAVSELGAGRYVGDRDRTVIVTCTFPFTVKNVPDSDFYDVEVSHRGALTYSQKQLERRHWKVAFSLGNSS